MAIDVGEEVTLQATFKDSNGDVTNVTEPVVVAVKNREGSTTQATASNQSTGVYEATYTPTTGGTHNYTFYTGETPPSIEQGTFFVNHIVAQKS